MATTATTGRDHRPLLHRPTEAASPATALPGGRRHRADIDGLRAFAVVAVVLSHAGVAGLSGGYIGVDVFFVISGFLIHGDLLRRSAGARLSLLAFYGRRMRRTLPALIAVGTATLLAAYLVLLPGELKELARSLAGALLLVPNVVFLAQTGYFDADAATKPLLHCWSLGVEEQFYLVAPVLVLGLVRLPRRARDFALLVLFGLALALCEAIRWLSPAAAFYLMPARAFEFLVGAAVAQGAVPSPRSQAAAEAVAGLGLVGLGASLAVFAMPVPHPGVATLLPCLATAAVIQAGQGAAQPTRTARLLGQRGPATIGLISYSLYLWHWPMLVLGRLAGVAETPTTMAAGAAALLALSYLTWRYVEQPFRAVGSPWRRRAPWLIPLGGGTLLAGAAATVAVGGLPSRFPADVAAVAGYGATADDWPFREGRCFLTSRTGAATIAPACIEPATDRPDVLLLGDSHAAHLWSGLAAAFPGVKVLQATASGCKPVIGSVGARRCTALTEEMLWRFVPEHHPQAVVLAGLWDAADIPALAATARALAPDTGRVVVVGPMPRYDRPVATMIARAMLHGSFTGVAARRLPTTRALDAAMKAALAPVATYVSPYRLLCPNDACRLFAGPAVPLQFDYHHLTAPGSAVLAALIAHAEPNLFSSQRSTSSR